MMPGALHIAMYHYVRPILGSRFPAVKGLEIEQFKAQLDHFAAAYAVVTMEHVMAACRGLKDLPSKALLLSFDDGYSDHFVHVFPLLHERGWQGSFFVPSCVAGQREVLEVNMIQFALQCCPSSEEFARQIDFELSAERSDYCLQPIDFYHREYRKATRFDDPATAYVKRMLQVVLPSALRSRLVREAFLKWVTRDEVAFAQELYCNLDQLRMMQRCGMHIGAHGDRHRWLEELPRDEQRAEIRRSSAFLDKVGVPPHGRSFCYPSGSYNMLTLELLAESEFEIGLTTEVGCARCEPEMALVLPRYDTNDFFPRGAL